MLVKYWMKKDSPCIDAGASMQNAMDLMKQEEVQTVPVLKNGKLVGVITDRDIKRASASDATSLEVRELLYLLSSIKVEDIMTKNPVTVPPNYSLEEAASLMLKNNISGAPVVNDQGEVVGVIGQKEVFKALISVTGLEKRGVQFAFQVEDRPGSIKEVTDVIRGYGGRLVSILTSYERALAGYRNIYVRAFKIDRERMKDLVRDLRAVAPILYMVDHREDLREEYI